MMKRWFFLIVLVLFLFLPNQSPVGATTEPPVSTLTVCIDSINTQTETAQVSFDLTMTQSNASGSILIGQINGPSQVYVLHLVDFDGQYMNDSSTVYNWPLQGQPQDYPFDSYSIQMSVQDNSITFSNGTTGAFSRLSYVEVSFCGLNPQALEAMWHVQSSDVPITQSSIPKPSHDVATIVIIKNEQSGLLVMLPIWIALVFVGALFLIDPQRSRDRISFLIGLFAFAPLYLIAVIGQSPPASVYNVAETQVAFLLITIVMGGLAALAGSSIISPLRQLLLDSFVLVVAETAYVALAFSLFVVPNPTPWVNYSYQIGLFSYFFPAVIPLVWRTSVISHRRASTLVAEIMLVIAPRTLGAGAIGWGVILLIFVPVLGAEWIVGGFALIIAFRIVRRAQWAKRQLSKQSDRPPGIE